MSRLRTLHPALQEQLVGLLLCIFLTGFTLAAAIAAGDDRHTQRHERTTVRDVAR